MQRKYRHRPAGDSLLPCLWKLCLPPCLWNLCIANFLMLFKFVMYLQLLLNYVLIRPHPPLTASAWCVMYAGTECQRRWTTLMLMDCIFIGIWTVLSAFALFQNRSDWSRRQRGAIRFTLPTASVASAWCDVPNVEALMDCVGIWTVRYLHCFIDLHFCRIVPDK